MDRCSDQIFVRGINGRVKERDTNLVGQQVNRLQMRRCIYTFNRYQFWGTQSLRLRTQNGQYVHRHVCVYQGVRLDLHPPSSSSKPSSPWWYSFDSKKEKLSAQGTRRNDVRPTPSPCQGRHMCFQLHLPPLASCLCPHRTLYLPLTHFCCPRHLSRCQGAVGSDFQVKHHVNGSWKRGVRGSDSTRRTTRIHAPDPL